MSLSIPSPLMERIRAEAERAYPRECCGLLAGTGAPGGEIAVLRIAPSRNLAEGGGHDRFEVDPKVRLALMRETGEIGGAGEASDPGPRHRIVGHYHSHPDHPPEPSAHDLAMAFEPDLLWLIVAVAKGRAGPAKAHAVIAGDGGRATGFKEIPLKETEPRS